MSAASTTISEARERPGRRGPGSKPARARSIAEFSASYDVASSDKSYARTRRRNAREERRAKDNESGELDRRRQELMVAFDAVTANTATEQQRRLVRDATDAEFFAKLYKGQQDAWDRMFGTGFVHPGGMVAGKYWRDAFIAHGLRSWEHPYIQRFVASMARAGSGKLRTGPAKDRCYRQFMKLPALDELYGFFCEECRDMFRLDLDRTFDSEAHLRAYVNDKVREAGLAAAPHVAVWIPDDRYHGLIIKPHLYVLLPEGYAVWPTSPPQQQRLLNQVINGLTRAFGCDPGGLANPWHGKLPTSPLTEYIILQDTHLPTLGEWAEALDVEYDPALIARRMMNDRMTTAGFDAADSNTWFSSVRDLANEAGRMLFKSGGFNITEQAAFAAKAVDVITPVVIDLIKPDALQHKTIIKLIETCTKFMVVNFDPAKMDTTSRDRGAAAHLMKECDTAKVRMSKGQGHSAAVKVRRTRATMSAVMVKMIKAGEEPTISNVAKASGRAYNTVKTHFFQCYVTAVASISVQYLVKGVHPLPRKPGPSTKLLLTANRPSDIPGSWTPWSGDTVLAENFKRKAVSLHRLRLRRPGTMSTVESIKAPGYNVMSFMSPGSMTVYHRKSTRHQAA